MIRAYGTIVVWGLILWLLLGAWRLRKRRVTPGAAAAAAMNDLLTNDRRVTVLCHCPVAELGKLKPTFLAVCRSLSR